MAKISLGLIILVFLGLRIIFWLTTFPNADEAYYWWWGQNFSLSYFDHPPLFAWMQGLVSLIFKNSLFGLRLVNVFTNGAFFYVYWRLLQYLYADDAKRYFWQLVISLLCSPLYFMMLGLAWHDQLLITLCLASGYYLLSYLDSYCFENVCREWQLYFAVFLLSLAVITKYNALLMGLGFLAAIGGDHRLRKLLSVQRIVVGCLIFFAVVSPVLVWNVQYDFPSFSYYLDRSVAGGYPLQRLLEPLGFVGFSLLMLSPFVGWYIGRSWQERDDFQFAQKTIYLRLAWHCFWIPTLLLWLVSFASTAYYYWNITSYLLLFPLIPVVIKNNKVWQGMLSFGMLFVVIFVCNYTVLPVSALFGADGDQDGRMLFGWERVAKDIISFSGTPTPQVITTDYRSGSALAFQLNTPYVAVVSARTSQFDFVKYPDSFRPNLILWDDWYPVNKFTLERLDIDFSRQVTMPVYRFGVLIKNYYTAPVVKFRDR